MLTGMKRWSGPPKLAATADAAGGQAWGGQAWGRQAWGGQMWDRVWDWLSILAEPGDAVLCPAIALKTADRSSDQAVYFRETPSRGWPERRPYGPLSGQRRLKGRDIAMKCALALLMTGVGGIAVFFAFALVGGF